MYGEEMMLMKAMLAASYTETPLFSVPMGGTADSDHAGPAGMVKK